MVGVLDLNEALSIFLYEQEVCGNSPKTIWNYNHMIIFFFNYLKSKQIFLVNDISVSIVKSYQLYLLRKKKNNNVMKNLSLFSVRSYMRHVKVFLSFCFKNNLINHNISSNIQLPKANKPVIEILSDDEIKKILNCYSEDTEINLRNKCIIYFMFDCGLRLSEVALIKLSDLNLYDCYVLILGKGRKERIIPLGNQLCILLNKYLDKRYNSNCTSLFLTTNHFSLTPNTVKCLCYHLKKITGIKRLHPHLFRHTFATNFLIAGLGDIYQLSKLLGHSSITITEHYLHIANYYKILRNQNYISYMDKLF